MPLQVGIARVRPGVKGMQFEWLDDVPLSAQQRCELLRAVRGTAEQVIEAVQLEMTGTAESDPHRQSVPAPQRTAVNIDENLILVRALSPMPMYTQMEMAVTL